MNSSQNPSTLLVHDGELADLHALLEELRTPFAADLAAPEAEDHQAPWELIIGTPKRLLALPFQALGASQQSIAICDQDSRTLRNSLHRAGIDLMIRRPVHPAVLRGLLLHALYRGPEKRRLPRASIGAPVRFRTGWRQHRAILADLSLGGCRLLTQQPAEQDGTITLLLPADLAGGKRLALKARVLRTDAAAGEASGTTALIAKFDETGAKTRKALKAILAAYASGPAKIDRATAAQTTVSAAAEPAAERPDQAAPVRPHQPTPIRPTPAASEPHPSSPRDRRSETRHTIDPLVVQLRDEAARVLVGRDISVGGMRVDPNRRLTVGQTLRIAIHVSGMEAPLVVTSKVHRDDGRDGLALRFVELSRETTEKLAQALEELPVLAPSGDARESGFVVSQILTAETG
jgi:hypothetical protein